MCGVVMDGILDHLADSGNDPNDHDVSDGRQKHLGDVLLGDGGAGRSTWAGWEGMGHVQKHKNVSVPPATDITLLGQDFWVVNPAGSAWFVVGAARVYVDLQRFQDENNDK